MKSKRSKACDISKTVKDEVWQRDNFRCIICGSGFAQPNAHLIRRSQSGLGIKENVVTLCIDCHHLMDNGAEKYAKPIMERVRGYLEYLYPDFTDEDRRYNKYAKDNN